MLLALQVLAMEVVVEVAALVEVVNVAAVVASVSIAIDASISIYLLVLVARSSRIQANCGAQQTTTCLLPEFLHEGGRI